MEATMQTTLAKWGNSQGLRIPKEACDLLGIGIGDKARVTVDMSGSRIVLTFEHPGRTFHRTRKVTIEELFEGYEGAYEPPTDWPTVGSEVDWGQPVGEEVW